MLLTPFSLLVIFLISYFFLNSPQLIRTMLVQLIFYDYLIVSDNNYTLITITFTFSIGIIAPSEHYWHTPDIVKNPKKVPGELPLSCPLLSSF